MDHPRAFTNQAAIGLELLRRVAAARRPPSPARASSPRSRGSPRARGRTEDERAAGLDLLRSLERLLG
jgi:hypothetical protein